MNNIINEDVLRKLYDSKKFNNEMYAFISETLDNELLKDECEIDCDLVCWCTNALIELEKESDDSFAVILPMVSDNQFLHAAKKRGFKSLSRGTRALIAACLTMFFAVTANAAVAEIFDYNIAQEIATAIQEKIGSLKNDDAVIEEELPALPIETTEKTSDSTTEPTTQTTTANRAQKSTPAAVKTEQSVKESTTTNTDDTSAVVKDEVVMTGVQGEAPKKLVYTTDDTELDLTGLRLRYVYSDNSYSGWFNESNVRVVKNIDFTKIGEQEIVLKINNTYEYKYKIILKSAEVKDDTIKSIKLGHTGFVNFTFALNEEPALDNLYLDITYLGGKTEKVYYKNCNEMSVVGINTSIETLGSQKQFTVYYKGFTVTADYVVNNRNNEIYYTEILYYGDRSSIGYNNPITPKTLYYYGEPLSVGNGIKPGSEQCKLISCDPFTDGDSPIHYEPFVEEGFTVMAKNVSSDGYVFYDSDELDIYGYDPYTLGFQTLDVYYNGMYLLSYNVFVYGDDGFCPANTINAFVDYGEESQLTVEEWYRCIGGGKLQSKNAYFDELLGEEFKWDKYITARENQIYKAMAQSSVVKLEDSEKVGWQNAKCTFNEDYSYDLRLSQRYNIYTYHFNYSDDEYFEFNMNDLESPDFDDAAITLTIKNLGNVTYSINDFRTVPRIVRDGKTTGSIIDNSLELESAFVRYQLLPDRTAFRLDNLFMVAPMVPAFVCADGFEDSITLNIIDKANYEDIYDINETEQSLIGRYDYYLAAKNNTLNLSFDDFCNCQVNVKDVSFGQVGKYDGTFYTTYNGRILESTRQLTIVQKLVTPTLKVLYDDNTQKALLQGDKLETDNVMFIYTNRKGDQIEISAKDTTIRGAMGVDDWGYITCDPGSTFRVDYTYKNATCYQWYHCWGKVTTINASNTTKGLRVTFKDTSFSDYYEITCGDTTVTVSEPSYTFDKSCLTDGGGYVDITPHIIVDGKDIAGVKAGTHYNYTAK